MSLQLETPVEINNPKPTFESVSAVLHSITSTRLKQSEGDLSELINSERKNQLLSSKQDAFEQARQLLESPLNPRANVIQIIDRDRAIRKAIAQLQGQIT